VAVTFGWPDTFTNDGNLILFKNGNRIGTCYSDASILCSCTPPACASIADCPGVGQCVVKNCGAQGCPTGSASCCDVGQNRWTIQTSSFSEFVFGAECAPTSVTHLTISRVNPPDGNEAFVFKGTFELGSLTLSDLDPVLHGLGLFLSDGNIAHEINATLLPGEYDPQTKQGWKVNPQGRQWTLVSVPSSGSPLPWGIKRVVLHELSPRQPGVVSFLIRGSQFPYPTTLPVEARVSLPGPGTCYSPGFGGSPPAPKCSINPRGTTLTCK
jgi:hypothetical protein